MTETKVSPISSGVPHLELDAGGPARAGAVREHYRRLVARRVTVILALLLALVVLSLLALCIGAASFGWREALKALAAGPWRRAGVSDLSQTVGVAIAHAAHLHGNPRRRRLGHGRRHDAGLLRNPLASPFTLGIASASGFGAALAITLGVGIVGWGQWLIVGNAFLFALLASGVVFVLAQWRGMSKETMILAGVATMYLFSALTSLLQYLATWNRSTPSSSGCWAVWSAPRGFGAGWSRPLRWRLSPGCTRCPGT